MAEAQTLEDALQTLKAQIPIHLQFGRDLLAVHDGDIYPMDLLVAGALNRSMAVVRGFSNEIKDNYLCAAHLVRLQLDTMLRFFGAALVADPMDFMKRVLSGERINRMKTKDGELMTDLFLVNKMEALRPGIKHIYERGCRYVHFSEMHIYHAVQPGSDEQQVEISVGEGDPGVTTEMRINAVLTMNSITDFFLFLVHDYLCMKVKLPKVRWEAGKPSLA